MSNKRAKWIIPPLLLVSTLVIISNIGLADFTTTDINQAIQGQVVIEDTSFTVGTQGGDSGIRIATASDADNNNGNPCSCTTPTNAVEIDNTNPYPRVRVNSVSQGQLVYRLVLQEATQLTAGTWAITVYMDGNQIGNTVYIKQQQTKASIEGVIILAQLGSSLVGTHVFEVNVQKIF